MNNPRELVKAEEVRQLNGFAQAIQGAIDLQAKEFADGGARPLIDSVAGALVFIEAAVLASVKDKHARKELRRVMERARSQAVAELRVNDKAQPFPISNMR